MRTTRSVALAIALPTAALTSQCTTPWAPLGPGCGVGGNVQAAIAWDPDGAGPATELLVVGGWLTSAGDVAVANIAAWDPATGAWSALGSGCNSGVQALAALPNGDLVAAGNFSLAGGAPASRIARWNGTTWSPLTTGIDGSPRALAVAANGDLIVGGSFQSAGGVGAWNVARWDGSTWSAIGAGLPAHAVISLAVLPNGDVVAAGSGTGSPTLAPDMARWDGSTWTPFGISSGSVQALTTLANGDLVAGGSFTTIDGVAASGAARWSGTTWSPLGAGPDFAPLELQVLANGDVVAAGSHPGGKGGIASWNGTSWSPLGGGVTGYPAYASFVPYLAQTSVDSLAVLGNGALFAGGTFQVAGSTAAKNAALWDGTQWQALSQGSGTGHVADLLVLPAGDVVAVGAFRAAGDVATAAVARWNGTTWSPIGAAMLDNGIALAVARLSNDDLVVAGAFSSIGGVAADNVAHWNGTQWSAMGSLPGTEVHDLLVAPDGSLFAGGASGVFTWNGSAWLAVGGGGGIAVQALAMMPDGRLIAGGDGTPANVKAWNGSAWTPLGSAADLEQVKSLAVRPNGDLFAGQGWGGPSGGHVARWNGSAWVDASWSSSDVDAVLALPDGELLASGTFYLPGGGYARGIGRWDGASWSALGGGIIGRVAVMAGSPTGDVWVGGEFTLADGAVSHGLARLTTTCPATVQVTGAGCDGDTLTASLPWIDAAWNARGDGLPGTAAVLVVNGFSATSLPLSNVFATALPGCTLHVQPDLVDLTLASNGSASYQLLLPNNPALVGRGFRQQMVSIDLNPPLAVTATNAIEVTAGAF